MAVILYDRFCVEIGFRGNTGYRPISIDSQLPYTVEFRSTMDGPIFEYAYSPLPINLMSPANARLVMPASTIMVFSGKNPKL